jgi:hypothetical protein
MTETKNKNLDFETFSLISAKVRVDNFNLIWDPLAEKVGTIRERGELEKLYRILKKVIVGISSNETFTELEVLSLSR